MRALGLLISLLLILALALFLLAFYGAARAGGESDAGTTWCAAQGGERLTSQMERVICLDPAGHVLPVPKDIDGVWP